MNKKWFFSRKSVGFRYITAVLKNGLKILKPEKLMKKAALAQMGMASFCAGVRHKRYRGQLEIASD